MPLPSVPPFQPKFNYPNNKLYQYETYPVQLQCNFVVDSTNGNGLGIRELKGAGIANVFMYTSVTPGLGNYGYLNPNPGAGIIVVQLQNQFNGVLSIVGGQTSPLTGSALTAITANDTYVITSLGTATAANWLAYGVPLGMTAAVGMAFVAKESASLAGSATVQLSGVSGIVAVEAVGNPNVSLQNLNVYQNGGGQIILQALSATSSSTTTLVPTAPANNSVITLQILMSNSGNTVNGL